MVSSTGPQDVIGGSVTITGGGSLWKSAGQVDVGGNGSVLVVDGGTLSSTGTFDVVGFDVVGDGSGVCTATITGAGSLWKSAGAVTVGNFGTGDLLVSAGGSFEALDGLTVGYGAIGSATINAASATAGDIWIGSTSGGNGTVLVANGGMLSLTGTYDAIGNDTGGVGTATITGAGSLWNSVGQVTVANLGTGGLLVSAGGSFEALDGLTVGYGAIGSATINAASATAGDIWIGSTSGGNGTVLVANVGTLSLTGTYDAIGNGTGGVGTATITGAGSLWNSVGQVTVANLGTGGLLVSAGGSFEALGGLTVGYAADGSATINAASATAGDVWIGGTSGGNGTVLVANVGTLSLTGTYDAIGNGTGGVGTATITGAGSLWNSVGQVTVAESWDRRSSGLRRRQL